MVEFKKGVDSDKNSLEYIQHKYGGNREFFDVESRNVFACCMPSMIKCIALINMHSDRIKDIDKCNVTAAFPMCFET